MTISMIGIDHGRAPVDIRALFAFTKKNAGEAMEKLKHTAAELQIFPALSKRIQRELVVP